MHVLIHISHKRRNLDLLLPQLLGHAEPLHVLHANLAAAQPVEVQGFALLQNRDRTLQIHLVLVEAARL